MSAPQAVIVDAVRTPIGRAFKGSLSTLHANGCVDALARVIRDADGNITSVRFAPINIASEETSGVDVTANYRLIDLPFDHVVTREELLSLVLEQVHRAAADPTGHVICRAPWRCRRRSPWRPS